MSHIFQYLLSPQIQPQSELFTPWKQYQKGISFLANILTQVCKQFFPYWNKEFHRSHSSIHETKSISMSKKNKCYYEIFLFSGTQTENQYVWHHNTGDISGGWQVSCSILKTETDWTELKMWAQSFVGSREEAFWKIKIFCISSIRISYFYSSQVDPECSGWLNTIAAFFCLFFIILTSFSTFRFFVHVTNNHTNTHTHFFCNTPSRLHIPSFLHHSDMLTHTQSLAHWHTPVSRQL